MNKARRKALRSVNFQLTVLMSDLSNVRDYASRLHETLEGILSDEQEAYDNIPPSLQEDEKGQSSQEAIDNIQSAMDQLQELIDFDLNDSYTHIEDAQQ